MKIPVVLVAFILLPCAAAFAGYSEDINGGNAAYKSGDYKTAYGYYVKAYKENPNRRLFDFLTLVRKKIYAQDDAGRPQNYMDAMAAKTTGGSAAVNWWVVGADTALAAFSAYAWYDYNRSTGDYNSTYDSINDTTHKNYLTLMSMKSSVESKGDVLAVSAAVTGIALLYTACDALFFHMAFPAETSAAFEGPGLKMAINEKF